MTACKNCKAEYTKHVDQCPQCGARIDPSKKAIGVAVVIVFIILLGIISFVGHSGGSQTQATNTPASQPTETSQKDLNADVKTSQDAVMVTNKDNTDWKDCKLELNNGWTATKDVIASNDSIIIQFSDFTKGDGTKFNTDTTQPQNISITCSNTGDGKAGFGYFGIK